MEKIYIKMVLSAVSLFFVLQCTCVLHSVLVYVVQYRGVYFPLKLNIMQGYIFCKILWWWEGGMAAGEKNEE